MKHTIAWNRPGDKEFEAGLDRGVLYPHNTQPGVAWNGLISVSQAPTGGTTTTHWVDGIPVHQERSFEVFGGTIQAYTYPDEFAELDGVTSYQPGLYLEQQERSPFGLSYRTRVGNDIRGLEHDYNIHLVYNALVSPSSTSYGSLSNTPTAANFSWSFVTTPIKVGNRRHTSKLRINRNDSDPKKFEYLESILYGYGGITVPRLPTIAELVELFGASYVFPGTGAP